MYAITCKVWNTRLTSLPEFYQPVLDVPYASGTFTLTLSMLGTNVMVRGIACTITKVTSWGSGSNIIRRYSPLRRLSSSSCGGLHPRLFLPFRQKKVLFMPFRQKKCFLCCFFSYFRCSEVTSVTFNSNHSNTERKKLNLKILIIPPPKKKSESPKNIKKKLSKKFKISKYLKNSL